VTLAPRIGCILLGVAIILLATRDGLRAGQLDAWSCTGLLGGMVLVMLAASA
jgi:hypothetical protein